MNETAPVLVLGPVLRYVGETAASIWLETDLACDVEGSGQLEPVCETDLARP